MASMSFQTQGNEGSEHRRAGAGHAEWSGIGWNESSWDLKRGLDVIEDLSLEAWPHEAAAA